MTNKGTLKKFNRSRMGTISGFTLIEITISIFLLASALTIILGLQTSSVSRAINDQNRLNAMLLARRVLTGLETGLTAPEVQDISVPALEYLPKDNIQPEEENTLKNFIINLKIEQWEIRGYDDIKVKRIFLNIEWGDDTEQTLAVYYFVPDNEDESIKQQEQAPS